MNEKALPTPSDWQRIRASLPVEKRAWDRTFPWIAYVCRPLSFPLAYGFHRLGMSANHVTGLTALLGGISLPLLALGTQTAAMWGGICLVLYSILDQTDGTLARAFPTSGPPVGKFWDQMVGNSYALSYFALGIGLARMAPDEALLWMILGGVSTIGKYFTDLTRLVFWKVLGSDWERQKGATETGYQPHSGRSHYRVYNNLTHLQGHVFLLPLAAWYGFLDIFLLATAVVTALQVVSNLGLYMKRSWQIRGGPKGLGNGEGERPS